jgi:SAM-dependent methyltransferase
MRNPSRSPGRRFGRLLRVSTPSPEETQPTAEELAIRARSFGAVARDYDRARPTYADAMADDIVALLPGTAVVEVGAGTGKATVLFGVRGLEIACIEPDPQMAAVLTENCRELPNVTISVSAFEDFRAAGLYDGLIAAQSWHWTDPARRWVKAASLLREGGLIALFWNRTQSHVTPLAPAIAAIYRRHQISTSNEPSQDQTPPAWPRDEMEKQPTLADVEVREYSSVHNYSTQEWCDYMASTSNLLILEPAKRLAVLAEVARVIDDEGGGVLEEHRRCDVYLARRTAVPA